jgi:hypothetical protein
VPDRRASRFALEVLFLVALAVALTLANQRPLVIAGLMLLGWVIAALVEWAAWRSEPHYGAGLPPRYYVPQVSLPPRRPLEQVGSGYPAAEQRDEAPTWIASPSLRAEVLGEWPHAAPAPGEDTEPDAEVEAEPEAEPVAAEPEPVAEPEPEPAAAAEPVPEAEPARRRLWGRRTRGAEDPWQVAELPAAPLDGDEPEREAEPEPTPVRVAVPTALGATARHRIDPLAEPEQKRRPWQRRTSENGAVAEVPARPTGLRVLPGRSRRED